MAEIQLKHVYKKYEDKVVAVQDFNLKIKDQEFVIFVVLPDVENRQRCG